MMMLFKRLVDDILPKDEVCQFLRSEMGCEFVEMLAGCSTVVSIKEIQDRLRPYYEALVHSYEEMLLTDDGSILAGIRDFNDHGDINRTNSKSQRVTLVRCLIDIINPDYRL